MSAVPAPTLSEDMWAEVKAALEASGLAPGSTEYGVLAVLYVERRLDITTKSARAAVARVWEQRWGRLPSEPVISDQREQLKPVRETALPLAADGDSPEEALRVGMDDASCAAFCERLRRDHGLLLEPFHLERALRRDGPKPLAPAVLAVVLDHLRSDPPSAAARRLAVRGSPRFAPAGPVAPLSLTGTAQRFKDALAYQRRLPGEAGVFALCLWCLTAGRPHEIDALADRVRDWVRRTIATDPASSAWDVPLTLTKAWAEVTRAAYLARPARKRPSVRASTTGWSWQSLGDGERTAIATLAAVPGREWSVARLETLAAVGRGTLDVVGIVERGWLVAVPGSGHEQTYTCPPDARRVVAALNGSRLPALTGLVRLWRDLLIPRLRDDGATGALPHKTLRAVFDEAIGTPLVVDCMDLMTRVVHARRPARAALARGAARGPATDGPAAEVEMIGAGRLARWMWRALSDTLSSYHLSLLGRLQRVADDVLGLVPPTRWAEMADHEWADLPAEHALIVAERAFYAWSVGERRLGHALLRRVGGTLPALADGLLPPLATMLARADAQRECWLTAQLSVIEYNILLARAELETLLSRDHPSVGKVRALAGALAGWRGHLTELAEGEAADERAKGRTPDRRWNYPALDRWDRGRTQATYHYWTAMSLHMEARAARACDPSGAESLFQQARTQAAKATEVYRAQARDNAKWDRVVHALLFQAMIERDVGRDAAVARWAIRAATQAMDGVVDGETGHLAIVCQLEAGAALLRLAHLYRSTGQTGRKGPAGGDTAELVAALAAFLEARRIHKQAEAGLWPRDIDIDAIRRGNQPLSAAQQAYYLDDWGWSFLHAMEHNALRQSPEVRGQLSDLAGSLVPGWRPSFAPPRRRHRRAD